MITTERPFIKKFEVDTDHYLYDVNTNEFFKVNEPVYRLIDPGEKDRIEMEKRYTPQQIEEAETNIARMKAEGYFSSRRPEITYFHTIPKTDFLSHIKSIIDYKLFKITLNVAEICNMRCRYCVYSGSYLYHRSHSNKLMSPEIMKKAVDFYFSHSRENNEKHISFYGGEPLINFDLIKECIAYIKETYDGTVEYNMTTNGTLLDKDKIKFLVENRFSLLISIDGPREIHDRYRVFKNGKSTFDRIITNLRTFKNLYPEYYSRKVRFNTVLAPPYDFKALKEFIAHTDVKPANINFADVASKFTSFFEQFDANQMTEFGAERIDTLHTFYRKLCNGDEPDELEKYLYKRNFLNMHRREMTKLPERSPSHGQCMLGERSLLINTDGTFNFCTQMEDVYNLGNIHDGYDYDLIEKIYFDLDAFFATKCRGCWAIRFCMKCIRNINREGKLDEELFNKFCDTRKKQILSDIQDYIKIRERNYHALDYLADLVLS